MGVVEEPLGLVGIGGADGIGTEFVDALRGKAQMAHDGDAGREDALDGFEHLFAPFQLDGVGAGLLHDADGGGESLLGVALIGAEGHVDDNEGPGDGAGDGGGVDDHLVEGDGEGGLVALHDVGGAVADEDDIDFGAVDELRHGVVVGGEHSDFLAMEFHILEHFGGHLGDIGLEVSHKEYGWKKNEKNWRTVKEGHSSSDSSSE